MNFAATAVLMDTLDIPIEGLLETAKNFSGVGRRFEITEAATGQIFIDDFAHHPSQVKSLFAGIRQFFPTQKTCAVFQPRQFNLMKNFGSGLIGSFINICGCEFSNLLKKVEPLL